MHVVEKVECEIEVPEGFFVGRFERFDELQRGDALALDARALVLEEGIANAVGVMRVEQLRSCRFRRASAALASLTSPLTTAWICSTWAMIIVRIAALRSTGTVTLA